MLLLRVPRDLVMPAILVFCIVGAFAITNSMFRVLTMLIFGLVGYLMEENAFPIPLAILGMVLSRMVEEQFMVSMIKAEGSVMAFVDRPSAALRGLLTIVVWGRPVVQSLRGRIASVRTVG